MCHAYYSILLSVPLHSRSPQVELGIVRVDLVHLCPHVDDVVVCVGIVNCLLHQLIQSLLLLLNSGAV